MGGGSGEGGRKSCVVETQRRSNKFQLVRRREELAGEDGPGGSERGGDLPDATQLLQQ